MIRARPVGTRASGQGPPPLLAATGFCLGCRLFFLRWWVPDLFARLVGRGIRREALIMVSIPTDGCVVKGSGRECV
jgi:hypothetical protein